MDDFVAYPSRPRIALSILGALVLVAGGLWMIGVFGPPPTSHRYPAEITFVIGWLSVAFFGLCAIAGVKRLFDGKERLRIGSAGIRVAPWSDQTIPWSEIVDVTTWRYRSQKAIVLHLRDRTRFPSRGLAAMFASANRSLTGGDVAISLVATNRRLEDALSAIDRFRSPTAEVASSPR